MVVPVIFLYSIMFELPDTQLNDTRQPDMARTAEAEATARTGKNLETAHDDTEPHSASEVIIDELVESGPDPKGRELALWKSHARPNINTALVDKAHQRALEDPGSTGATLNGTQGDGVTLAVLAVLTEQPEDSKDSNGEVEAATKPDNMLEAVTKNPDLVPELIMKAEPKPGGAWKVLTETSPSVWLGEDPEKTIKTKEDFFNGLRLRQNREDTPTEEGGEVDEVGLRVKLHEEAEKRNPPSRRERLFGVGRLTLRKQDAQTIEDAQDARLKGIEAGYERLVRDDKPEGAINLVKDYLKTQSAEFRNLSSAAYPEATFNGRTPVPMAPGHVERLMAFLPVAYTLRHGARGVRAADEGLIKDVENIARIKEIQRDQARLPRPEDLTAYMAGNRDANVTREAMEDAVVVATLSLLQTMRRGGHIANPAASVQALAGLLSMETVQGQAQAYAANPGNMHAGHMPPLTNKELINSIEVAGFQYYITRATSPALAERVLARDVSEIQERVRGHTLEQERLGIDKEPSPQIEEPLPSRDELDKLIEAARARISAQKGETTVANLTERRELDDLINMRAAIDSDTTGTLATRQASANMKAAQSGKKKLETGRTRILAIDGSVEAADGRTGAVVAAIGASGLANVVEIYGGTGSSGAGMAPQAEVYTLKGSIPGDGRYRAIFLEGRAPPAATPQLFIQQLEPNGASVIPVTPNAVLAAHTVMLIDPTGYGNSKVLQEREQSMRDSDRRYLHGIRQNTSPNTAQKNDCRWLLMPSTVCRFNMSEGELYVEYGHAQALRNRPEDWSLVVCRNKPDGSPSDAYLALERIAAALHSS